MKNNMTKHSIYCSDESRPLEEALKIITDEWVDDGSYCAQTVIDLRDALKFYINKTDKLENELDKFREAVKSSHDVLLTVVNECNLFYKESADIDNYTVSDCHSVLDKIKKLRY
jgi:hypothetical protein